MRPTVVGMVVSLLVAAACGGGDDPPRAPMDTPVSKRLVAVGDGVVFDPETSLAWTNRDHHESLDWEAADRHCRELSLGQRSDWRLPEIGEMRGLFDRRFDEPCGESTCHLDPAIRLSGPYVWSGTARGPEARFYFDFTFATSLSPHIGPVLVRRVLCVRQRSSKEGP